MSFMIASQPIPLVLFALCYACVILACLLNKNNAFFALLSGILAVGGVVTALAFSIPLIEIFTCLLFAILLAFVCMNAKGEL